MAPTSWRSTAAPPGIAEARGQRDPATGSDDVHNSQAAGVATVARLVEIVQSGKSAGETPIREGAKALA